MPTALITGISGQDGTYLADLLLNEGYTVHGTVTSASDAENNVPRAKEISLHIVDMNTPGVISTVIDDVEPDEIYNLAALSSVYHSWVDPFQTAMINGLAVAELLAAAWVLYERGKRKVSVIQASSAELFGTPEETPQTEGTRIRPTSPYGAAKAYAHHLVGVYRGRGLQASSAILYNHESPLRPETFVTRKITAGVARIAAGRQNLIELGTLDVRRDWGWAPDYARAMRLMAGTQNIDDFVIATGETHSITDFLSIAFQRVGIADWQPYVRISDHLVRPVDPAQQVGDSSHAQKILGWVPTKTFDEIVHAMVDHDLAIQARNTD
jgi:GDPmannose 4,6-dehydratase